MNPVFKYASAMDHGVLLGLMRDYYDFEGIPFDPAKASSRLHYFLSNPAHGFALLVRFGHNTVGYAVVVQGFGLEHGRNATIDEIFITEPLRGKGLGTDLVRHIETIARNQGIESLQADVEHANEGATSFWKKLDFVPYNRSPMIRMLT